MGKQGLLYRFDQRGIDKEMARRAVNFSVSDNHEKLLGIIDAKKQTGNFSDWICKTLIAKWEDEQKGSKITAFAPGTQDNLTTFPPIHEQWSADKLQRYSPEDLQKVHAEIYKRKEELAAYLKMLAKAR